MERKLCNNQEPRNLVICCDGKRNQFGDENSNVVKLYQALVTNGKQVGYYLPGVGTMSAPNARNRIDKQWTKIKGLAFGAGVTANLSDAYRYGRDGISEGRRG